MSSLLSITPKDFHPLNVCFIEGTANSSHTSAQRLSICHLSITPSVETAWEEGKYLSQVLFGSDVIVVHTDQAKPSISLTADALKKVWEYYFSNASGQLLIQSFYGNGYYPVSLALEHSPYAQSITVVGMDSPAVLQYQNAFSCRSADQMFHYEKELSDGDKEEVSTIRSVFNPAFIPGLKRAFRKTLTKKFSQHAVSETSEEWLQACLRAVTNMGWACLRVSEYAQLMLFYDRSREAALQIFDKHRHEVLSHGNMSNLSTLFKGSELSLLQTLELAHKHYSHLEVLASFWLMQSIVHAMALIMNPLEFRWRRAPFLLTALLIIGSVGDILENMDFIFQREILPVTGIVLHGGIIAYSSINLLNEALHLTAYCSRRNKRGPKKEESSKKVIDVKAANVALCGGSLLIAGALGCVAHLNSTYRPSGSFSMEDFFLIGKILIIVELFWIILKWMH